MRACKKFELFELMRGKEEISQKWTPNGLTNSAVAAADPSQGIGRQLIN